VAPRVFLWVDADRDTFDESGDFIASLGGNKVITDLIARTDLSRIGKGQEAKDVQPPAVRQWAVRALGTLDFKRMAEAQRSKVVVHLRHLRASERNAAVRELAAKILTRLGELPP
jgi:hypothetical protein